MDIRLDDLCGPEIAGFLNEHIAEMHVVSPRESNHAIDLEGLRHPDICVWTAWQGSTLVGCGALKALDPAHAEIKSMRTGAAARGMGIASSLLRHILDVARERGFRRVSLETGAMAFFAPARRLYLRHGFAVCAPFADYRNDPDSVFMSRTL